MSISFTGQVVWITGASSGIGEALAYAFSVAGARVILSSRRADELERVRRGCAHPEQVRVLPLDLLDIPSLTAKTAEAISYFGQIDRVIHNGGVSQRGLVKDTSLEVQRRVMELDYFSYVALTQGGQACPAWILRLSSGRGGAHEYRMGRRWDGLLPI
jgi:dehydrogenase/reductase SDR family member 7B